MLMLKRGIFIVLVMSFYMQLSAQSVSVSRDVLVCSGSVASIGGFSVSQTIGEPVVKHIGNESFMITQGFQQPSASRLIPIDHTGTGVKVYPNPVRYNLTLELFGERDIEYHVTIFGFNGAIYFKNDYPCSGCFFHPISIDVSNYQRGTYFVRVLTNDGTIKRLFKIEKM